METHSNSRHIPYAPTETADLYPESDGKPMAGLERLKARVSDD